MLKIGFIDYYLDEWHANNYPEFFKNAAGDDVKVCYAYGEIDAPGKMTNKEWTEKYGVELLDSIEEVVEKSDCLVVLAPDNPETHVHLTKLPLMSKKPVYVDKTFANSKEEALAIFRVAEESGTPCYSSSALYFSDEIAEVDTADIARIDSIGGGIPDNYSIHQIEQIIKLMGTDFKRVMCFDDSEYPMFAIEFSDGRIAHLSHFWGAGFGMTVGYKSGANKKFDVTSDFFANCIKSMTEFFKTGVIPVSHEQTVAVIYLRELCIKAAKTPLKWIEA